jgi:signal transduction histidine kinase
MLGRIIRQGARLREIVEDLLTVARSDSLVFNQVDLVLLLRAIADDMREFTPPSCTIRVDSSLDKCIAKADADQLAVALRNLLDNARQAIGTRENGLIECTLEIEDEMVRITVRDNGIGMSEETRRRLFQPFYSEKEGGSGIGTTILRRVIEGHRGRIEVQSELGRGSQFDLLLPLKASEEVRRSHS